MQGPAQPGPLRPVRDFRNDESKYRDFDNLFAMYVLHNMGRYRVKVNDATKPLEIENSKSPVAGFADARNLAAAP